LNLQAKTRPRARGASARQHAGDRGAGRGQQHYVEACRRREAGQGTFICAPRAARGNCCGTTAAGMPPADAGGCPASAATLHPVVRGFVHPARCGSIPPGLDTPFAVLCGVCPCRGAATRGGRSKCSAPSWTKSSTSSGSCSARALAFGSPPGLRARRPLPTSLLRSTHRRPISMLGASSRIINGAALLPCTHPQPVQAKVACTRTQFARARARARYLLRHRYGGG